MHGKRFYWQRERKMLKKGLVEFLPGSQDPLAGSAHLQKSEYFSFFQLNLVTENMIVKFLNTENLISTFMRRVKLRSL